MYNKVSRKTEYGLKPDPEQGPQQKFLAFTYNGSKTYRFARSLYRLNTTIPPSWLDRFDKTLQSSWNYAQQHKGKVGDWQAYCEMMTSSYSWMDTECLARAWVITTPYLWPENIPICDKLMYHQVTADIEYTLEVRQTATYYYYDMGGPEDYGFIRVIEDEVPYTVEITLDGQKSVSSREWDITTLNATVDNPTQQRIAHIIRHALQPQGVKVSIEWQGLYKDRLYPEDISS